MASDESIASSSSLNDANQVVKRSREDAIPAKVPIKPLIRVRGNLTQKVSLSDGMQTKKVSTDDLRNEINTLKQEILSLNWLIKRKEQEWNNALRLLKQKELRLMQTEKQLSVQNVEVDRFIRASESLGQVMSKPGHSSQERRAFVAIQPQTGNQRPEFRSHGNVGVAAAAAAAQRPGQVFVRFLSTTKQPPQLPLVPLPPAALTGSSALAVAPSQQTTISSPKTTSMTLMQSTGGMTPSSAKGASVSAKQNDLKTKSSFKDTVNFGKKSRKATCENCHLKPAQFICAGCSNKSYCSKNCQEADWDNHSDFCS